MMSSEGNGVQAGPASGGPIEDEAFCDLVRARARALLDMAGYLSGPHAAESILTRPLLGSLMFQSTQLEELLDEYSARQNRRWCRFRALTATVKRFARVGYEAAHLHHRRPAYRLLPVGMEFAAATRAALLSACKVVEDAAAHLLEEAKRLGVFVPADVARIDYAEQLPPGRLPHDRDERRVGSAAMIVTQLATGFLNLAAESELLHTVAKVSPENYTSCFPEPANEERLRYLTHRFHNLQSLYDTHVAGTQVEHLDADVPVLRGHASAIFHLLEIATDLAHYYERHMSPQTGDPVLRSGPVAAVDAAVPSLFGYAIAYSSLYLEGGQHLCQAMLKRYAELGRIEVPVPNYRGFHVRPSNLVARIVMHYGSNVDMELDDEVYDAGSPLELFRANEKINARKRRWLAAEIAGVPLRQGAGGADAIGAEVLDVALRLAEQGKLVIYEQPLRLSGEHARREGSVAEQVAAEIAGLQASGQLDLRTDLTVAFSGDKRVLADIELLARHGYGEDSFGNNVTLPAALAYLRR